MKAKVIAWKPFMAYKLLQVSFIAFMRTLWLKVKRTFAQFVCAPMPRHTTRSEKKTFESQSLWHNRIAENVFAIRQRIFHWHSTQHHVLAVYISYQANNLGSSYHKTSFFLSLSCWCWKSACILNAPQWCFGLMQVFWFSSALETSEDSVRMVEATHFPSLTVVANCCPFHTNRNYSCRIIQSGCISSSGERFPIETHKKQHKLPVTTCMCLCLPFKQ